MIRSFELPEELILGKVGHLMESEMRSLELDANSVRRPEGTVRDVWKK